MYGQGHNCALAIQRFTHNGALLTASTKCVCRQQQMLEPQACLYVDAADTNDAAILIAFYWPDAEITFRRNLSSALGVNLTIPIEGASSTAFNNDNDLLRLLCREPQAHRGTRSERPIVASDVIHPKSTLS